MQRTFSVLASVFSSLVVSSLAASASPAPVVGGSTVPSSDWPDVVGVIGPTGRCTGTLIAPDVVITAGHCADLQPTEVVTFADDLARGAPGEHVKVKWTRAFPNWESTYDVSVVMLERPARPAPRAVISACDATAQLHDGASVTVVGYGLATASGTDNNSKLRAARMPVIDASCTDVPGCNPDVAPNGELAAGGRGIDSCFGDSGGPAFIETPTGPALLGVVSRSLDVAGPPCGSGGIYVRADKVVNWIEQQTGRRLKRSVCGGAGSGSGAGSAGGSGPDRPSDDPGQAADDGGCSVAGTGAGRGVAFGAPLLLGIAVAIRRRRR